MVLTLAGLTLAFNSNNLIAGWTRTYGGETHEVGYCVQPTSDGGYIISGHNDGQLWLLRTDAYGDTLWTRTYGVVCANRDSHIESTSDGGYIVTAGAMDYGFWLLKINEEGDTLWTRTYGYESCAKNELSQPWKGNCVRETPDRGYIATGLPWTLLKTDEWGDTLWTREYGGQGKCIQLTSDSGYVVIGSDSTNGLYFLKTDAQGNILWKNYYGEDYSGYNCWVEGTSDGGYIFVAVESANYDIWLVKTDAFGDTLWTRTYGGEGIDWGRSVKPTSDGGYIITGETWSFGPGESGLWLLKTDAQGDTIWTRTFGGTNSDGGWFGQQTSDGGYILTGVTWSFGAGWDDLWLLKTDSLGLLATDEQPAAEAPGFEVISPVGRRITLQYSDLPCGFNADVFDASGRKVDELQSSTPSGTLTWGGGFSPGVYFIRPLSSNPQTTRKVVLIK